MTTQAERPARRDDGWRWERERELHPRRPSRGGGSGGGLADFLGWFSLGLGLAGFAAPERVARLIGVGDDDRTREMLRMVGAREIVSGIGILTQPRPTGWLWSRVAGDVMDLALLGSAVKGDEADRDRVTAAAAAVVGVTALDLYCSQQMAKEAAHGDGATEPVRSKAITIYRPVEEVYAFWRDFRNLARFMKHVESVQMTSERTSHWRAEGPAGTHVEWDAETVEDVPNSHISWRSLPGSHVANWGTVRFRSVMDGRATEVRLELRWKPPAGRLGEAVAMMFGRDPGQMAADDLRSFKQVLETGELVRSDASIRGAHFPQRPAQPPTEQDLAHAAY